jgi:hypothetical protein
MELLVIAVLLVVGGVALALGLRMLFSSKQGSRKSVNPPPAEANRRRDRAGREGGNKWQELEIEWRHPGSDWVYLPKFDKDNECKLVCISDMGHREAVKPLIKSVTVGRDYSISLKREPTNRYDSNAIQVVDQTNGSDVVIGYLPKEVAAVISDRYSAEMPISVMVKRAIKSPDGEIYLRLAPLIPKKPIRKPYELH